MIWDMASLNSTPSQKPSHGELDLHQVPASALGFCDVPGSCSGLAFAFQEEESIGLQRKLVFRQLALRLPLPNSYELVDHVLTVAMLAVELEFPRMKRDIGARKAHRERTAHAKTNLADNLNDCSEIEHIVKKPNYKLTLTHS